MAILLVYLLVLLININNRPLEVGFTIGSPSSKCPVKGGGSIPPLYFKHRIITYEIAGHNILHKHAVVNPQIRRIVF